MTAWSACRPRAAILGVLIAAGCGDSPPPEPPAPAPKSRPSVVLISLDTTRADRLGCYGYAAAETPVIDELSRGGVTFDQARTPVPLTLPAHTSLLTGVYPPSHGIRDNGVAELSDRASTLAERLRDAGYQTGAFVASVVLDPRFGLDQGFDVYDAVEESALVATGFLEERPANEVVDAATRWLTGVDGPYFLWVHLFDPHAPYAPPAPYDQRFSDRPYDGEIAFVDEQVGRLVRRVRERGDGDRAYIALTADHGEGLGDHGETSHGVFVYDSCVRVPLILNGPGLPAGSRVSAPASLVDVPVTLLDACGVDPWPYAQGRSLLPVAAGEDSLRRAVYFESYNGYLNHGWSPLVGLTNGRDKIIVSPHSELYDVIEDPTERLDRAATDRDVLARLRDAARQHWDGLQSDDPVGVAREVSAEERRALAELGYTTSGSATGKLPFPSDALPDPREHLRAEEARNRGLALINRFRDSGFRDRAAIDAAVETLTSALRDDPDSAVLHEYAGTALVLRTDFPAAVHHLRAALAKRPERTDARYNLAVALLESGERRAACEQLDRLLDFEPDFVKAAKLLAVIHEQDGRIDDAIAAIEHFLSNRKVEDAEQRSARNHLAKLRRRSSRDP